MSVDLRLPNITGATPQERQAQMESYMHQFVEQLQWALNNIDMVQANGSYYVTPSGGNIVSGKQSAAVDALSTFATLKPLIIKSAEIVTAYYEKMKERFDGLYVAESDFGTYTEQTSQEILKTSTDITQAFTNIQALDTEVGTALSGVDERVAALKDDVEGSLGDINEAIEDVADVVAITNAYVKSGHLYDDESTGLPVYGVEVRQMTEVNGEEVFNKCAQFTAGQLTFFDKDVPIAWISGYKLVIANAEFTGQVKFGAFLLDTSEGFRLKWAGRG